MSLIETEIETNVFSLDGVDASGNTVKHNLYLDNEGLWIFDVCIDNVVSKWPNTFDTKEEAVDVINGCETSGYFWNESSNSWERG